MQPYPTELMSCFVLLWNEAVVETPTSNSCLEEGGGAVIFLSVGGGGREYSCVLFFDIPCASEIKEFQFVFLKKS